MKKFTLAIIFFLLTHYNYGQKFINAFKIYRLEKTRTILNPKLRAKNQGLIISQIKELDTIIKSYYRKTKFDFNVADSIFMIYDSPAESPFTSAIIIWSGNDTISYRQGFTKINSRKNKRIINYESFLSTSANPTGFKIVTERDSVLTLVSKRDFTTLSHLGDNQTISDGNYLSIYVAYKVRGGYNFETCFPRQFIIRDIYKKE